MMERADAKRDSLATDRILAPAAAAGAFVCVGVSVAATREREFGVISDDAAESILTVGDAVKFLEKYAVA
jgi:hypothetical protein